VFVVSQQKFVAFIDILGFKNTVGEFKDPMDLGGELMYNFNASLHAALSNTSATNDLAEASLPKVENKEISFWQFSDSIIFYKNDDNRNGLNEFIRTLNLFRLKRNKLGRV